MSIASEVGITLEEKTDMLQQLWTMFQSLTGQDAAHDLERALRPEYQPHTLQSQVTSLRG